MFGNNLDPSMESVVTLNPKQARRAAAQAETQRRWRDAEANCPLTRKQFQALLDSVAEQVAEYGHENSFEYTDAWLGEHAIAVPPVHAFLNEHKVHDDYELIVQGDPYSLFGPTPDRLKWMPVGREDLDALIAFVEESCGRDGCDHSHRFTRDFLAARSLPLGITEMALLAQGGGCDCEVVLNVDPGEIYPHPHPAQ